MKKFNQWLIENKNIPAVLLATGAFSPIHRGHLEMFKESKDYLESQGYHVIKGYISPKHNDYVAGKTSDYLDIDERIELINKSIKDSGLDWIEVFDWEARQPSPMGKRHVVNKIKQLHPGAEVFFICGQDNCPLPSYPGIADMAGFKWVSIKRSGFSSTKVRKALKSNDEEELILMLYPSVKSHLNKRGSLSQSS